MYSPQRFSLKGHTHTHTPIFAYQDPAHKRVHIHYKLSDNTLPDTHALPSRLPSEYSKHSCQN